MFAAYINVVPARQSKEPYRQAQAKQSKEQTSLTANICARFDTLGNISFAGNGGREGTFSDLAKATPPNQPAHL